MSDTERALRHSLAVCRAKLRAAELKLEAFAGAEQHLERVPGHVSQNEGDGWRWKDERLERQLAAAEKRVEALQVECDKTHAESMGRWGEIQRMKIELEAAGVMDQPCSLAVAKAMVKFWQRRVEIDSARKPTP